MKNNVGMQGVFLKPQKIIKTKGGDVLHGLRATENSFHGFGEAYFSTVEKGEIKGWKRHKKMTLNLLVPIGEIKFVVYDDRPSSSTCKTFFEVFLSKNNYSRLTLPPLVWLAFEGKGDISNVLLNIANIEHQPDEVDKRNLNEIDYDWQ